MTTPLGNLIKEKHVTAALELLSAQLASAAHSHRSLDLGILRREGLVATLDAKKFCAEYLDRDTLFNYHSLFGTVPFAVPKGDGGVRRFHFLEAHLLVLYYALGFYCLELTANVRTELEAIQARANIHTYYGANIRLNAPSKSQIHYQDDYQEFTRRVRRAVGLSVRSNCKVAVLHLDIQDFFGSIEHSRLVEVLEQQCLPSSRLALKYDENAKESVRDLLFFIMDRPHGVPLGQQNIVSNLLSTLFLYPLDCHIRSLQLQSAHPLRFYRYVDDMFITVDFPPTMTGESIGEQLMDTSTRIGEFLAEKLGLSLNPLKTRLDLIVTQKDVEDLIEKSRLVSFCQPLPDGPGEKPQETLERALSVVEALKEEFRQRGHADRITANDDIALKECFRSAVVAYTQSEQAREDIEVVFEGFNPILMPKSIKVLVFLLSRAPQALASLYRHVSDAITTGKPSLTSLHLADRLMLLPEYNGELDKAVASLGPSSGAYATLLRRLVQPSLSSPTPHVDILPAALLKHIGVMQQLRRMVLAEKQGAHNLAFSHLLNALHHWCHAHDPNGGDRRQYTRTSVITWLESRAHHDDIAFVMSMFDRRNTNAISHPGEEGSEVLSVDRDEYLRHLARLNEFFGRINPLL